MGPVEEETEFPKVYFRGKRWGGRARRMSSARRAPWGEADDRVDLWVLGNNPRSDVTRDWKRLIAGTRQGISERGGNHPGSKPLNPSAIAAPTPASTIGTTRMTT